MQLLTPPSNQHQTREILRTKGIAGIVEDNTILAQAPKIGAVILFDFDSDKIKPESIPLLQEYVKALKILLPEGMLLVIAGHTDSIGSKNYNMALSIRRAQSVKNFLMSTGIPADRLFIKGFGESKPLTDNDTEAGRSINRRVEFFRIQ